MAIGSILAAVGWVGVGNTDLGVMVGTTGVPVGITVLGGAGITADLLGITGHAGSMVAGSIADSHQVTQAWI